MVDKTANVQLSNQMNCVLIEKDQVGDDGSIALDAKASKHALHVLNKKAGDFILAGIIDGPISLVPILEASELGVRIGIPKGATPPEPPVDLILAMPRPKVMKRLWGPLASMGVRNITIIGAERVEPFYFDSHALDEAIFRPLLIEGLEQARDTRIPKVKIIKAFPWFAEKHLASISPDAGKIIGQPGAGATVREVISSSGKPERIVLAVGPEGGWTAGELDTFSSHGFFSAGMRDRALRTDTAIISLLALVYDGITYTEIPRSS